MSTGDNKSFWQKTAKIYTSFMKGSAGTYDEIARFCAEYLKKTDSVLELACGPGQITYRLFKYAAHWEATDFSENMINEAKNNSAAYGSCNISFRVCDAVNLPYGDGCFDDVMIANALHIMPNPQGALNEIARVLRSGGILFAPTFIHGEGAAYNLRLRLMNAAGFKTYSKWTAEEFAAFVCENGFEIIESTVIDSKIKPLCCLIARRV